MKVYLVFECLDTKIPVKILKLVSAILDPCKLLVDEFTDQGDLCYVGFGESRVSRYGFAGKWVPEEGGKILYARTKNESVIWLIEEWDIKNLISLI